MSGLKHRQSSALVLALLAPLSLTACGTAVHAPAATGTASSGGSSQPVGAVTQPVAGVVSTATNTVGTGVGTVGTGVIAAVGDQVATAGSSLPAPVGTIVTGAGDTVAGVGNSLGNDALGNPLGVTVLNSTVTDTTSKDLVDASVISNTPASNAPVQANVLANGQIASASISNDANVPVVSPLLAGATSTIDNATGMNIGSSAGLTSIISPVTGVTGQLNGAAAPLDPLLNVSVANNQLVGSGPAAITVGLDSGDQLVDADVTTPAGVPNPVNELVSTVAGPTSPLYLVSAPLGAPASGLASANPLTSLTSTVTGALGGANPLAGVTGSGNPLSGVTGALGGAASGSNPVTTLISTVTSATGSTGASGLTGALNGVTKLVP